MKIKFSRLALSGAFTIQLMGHLIERLNKWQVALALVLSTLIVSPAVAQVDAWVIANCPGFKQPPLSTMVDLCNGHDACAAVVSSYDKCPRVQKFLETLDASIPQSPSGLAGIFSRRLITPEALWRANMPPSLLMTEAEPVTKELLARIDQFLPLNATPTKQFKRNLASGAKLVVYIFDANDALKQEAGRSFSIASGDVIEGPAMIFFSNGSMRRAYYVDEKPETAYDAVNGVSGLRLSLIVPNSLTDGPSVQRYPGTFSQAGVFVGQGIFVDQIPRPKQGTFTRPDGTRFEGQFEAMNVRLQNGKSFRPDGTLEAEGVFDNAGLSVGTRYDASGTRVVESVDKIKAQANAAAAAREAADRQRRDQEAAKAAQEAQYKSTLAKSNAGQLFAMAEQSASAGDSAKTRETRLALISRFPNHPLAATAAQQMAGSADSRPGATASSTGSRPVFASGAAQSSGVRCSPDSLLIPAYVQAQHDWVRYANNSILRPITTEGAIARFNESYDQYSKSMSTERLRESLAESRRYYANWGSSQLNPQQAHSLAESRITNAMIECEIQRRGSVPSSVANSASGSAGCASTPQESFRRFDKEMSDFAQSKPNAPPTSSSGSGARAQNQYALFYGTEGLMKLEKYRNCLSAADYEANKKALEGMRDNGRAGCERLSTSPGSCTATYPVGWPSR